MSDRDTHFVRFAELLWNELAHLNGDGYIDINAYDDNGIDPVNYRLLIAQRAYDLVKHTIEQTAHIDLDRLSPDEHAARIPDITEWSETEQ